MQTRTQYIADLSLWLVVRKRFTETGRFIEPAWVGDGVENGPVLFTSRMLAAVYAYMRNKYHGEDDSASWQVMPLQAFDLLEHARTCCDGTIHCMMAFGLPMEDAGSIIVKTGAPRLRYRPHPFTPPADAEALTFSFHRRFFEWLRGEFRAIGFRDYEADFERVDEMDEAAFNAALKTAIARVNVCREPTDGRSALWGAFCATREIWISGTEEGTDESALMAHDAPSTLQ